MTIARRIADLLADGRAGTVAEIARELRVRDADVREALRSDPRFERCSAPPGRSPQARPWTLAGELVPRDGTTSASLDGRAAADEQARASVVGESLWRLALSASEPHSVGEAVAAAGRRFAA